MRKRILAEVVVVSIVVIVIIIIETGSPNVVLLAWNTPCTPGWPRLTRDVPACVPSADIKDVCHLPLTDLGP